MRYILASLCILVLTGCGSLSRNEVPSDVVLDDFGQSDLTIPANNEEESEASTDELAALEEANTFTLEDIDEIEVPELRKPLDEREGTLSDDLPEQEKEVRISPVTGPEMPEAELRKIYNKILIERGEEPRF